MNPRAPANGLRASILDSIILQLFDRLRKKGANLNVFHFSMTMQRSQKCIGYLSMVARHTRTEFMRGLGVICELGLIRGLDSI
jgi:hypothetical protein